MKNVHWRMCQQRTALDSKADTKKETIMVTATEGLVPARLMAPSLCAQGTTSTNVAGYLAPHEWMATVVYRFLHS